MMGNSRNVTLGLVLASACFMMFTGCSSSSANDDDVLNVKRNHAIELLNQTDSAVLTADDNQSRGVELLWTLCEQAKVFTDGLIGSTGWEYPGDVPERYDVALYTPVVACYLHDAVKEFRFSDVAEYVRQLNEGLRCLQWSECLER